MRPYFELYIFAFIGLMVALWLLLRLILEWREERKYRRNLLHLGGVYGSRENVRVSR